MMNQELQTAIEQELQTAIEKVRKTNIDGTPYGEYSHSNTDWMNFGRDVQAIDSLIEYHEDALKNFDSEDEYALEALLALKEAKEDGYLFAGEIDGRDSEYFKTALEALEYTLSDLNHNTYNGQVVPRFIIID